jgi:Transposase family tnp2
MISRHGNQLWPQLSPCRKERDFHFLYRPIIIQVGGLLALRILSYQLLDQAADNTMSPELIAYLNQGPQSMPIEVWPDPISPTCTHRSTCGSDVCGARLATTQSIEDTGIFTSTYRTTHQMYTEAQLKPHLTFYVPNFQHWLAELVSRPGMLEIVKRDMEPHNGIDDIMQGKAIRELIGPDGKPFIQSDAKSIHLCFGLFFDFFNSEGNFIGGKHKSTGGIFLVVLNLPLHLRYAPENMFPIFTPGGREPTTEELNNLLRPFVDQLIAVYSDGIIIRMRQGGFRTELDLRGMLAIIIADTPAAKKIGGFASHAQRWFCHMCRLGREEMESNLEPATWSRLCPEHHDALAKAWRDAPTTKLREELFSFYGVRFSELHRIPYLRLTECIGAEPMHSIMQNTIQHHIRRTFGIDAVQGDQFYDSEDEGDIIGPSVNTSTEADNAIADTPEVRKGLGILNRPGLDTRSLTILSNMRVTTLITLCDKFGISAWVLPLYKGQPKRAEMVEALARKVG